MKAYDEYTDRLKRISDISHAVGVLHWDMEVNMPSSGAQDRSRQIATLSGIAHDMATDKRLDQLIGEIQRGNTLAWEQERNVELSRKDFDQQAKLDKAFVEKLSATQSRAYVDWVAARKENDFSLFSESLGALVALRREEAHIRGYAAEPYDALLELYEPDLRAEFLDQTFTTLRDQIIPFLKTLQGAEQVENAYLYLHYDKDEQWEFGLDLLRAMGYDFERGRQDISPHPFTISFSPNDVRVTTRIDENDFLNMTWSCIHELGHALYAQGLPAGKYGLPSGSAVSLAIHESQSRLWENHVGRSREFWTHWLPLLKARFPQNLGKVGVEEFYRGINKIEPNLIRTEADELHYHLHVIIRYELERDLINGNIEVDDLPALWNKLYKEYLDVDVPGDDMGVLQDVHWSHGSFGYFPTYSLGSLYAAQFFATATDRHPEITAELAKGQYGLLLNWLRENIHSQGRLYDPQDLCKRVTGEQLNPRHFVEYAKRKFRDIYALGAG